MTVRGALRTMSVEDVLEWVRRRELSGVLTVGWSSLERTFAFDAGRLAGSVSNEPSEHLIQLLRRAGALDEVASSRVLARQEETGRSLVDLLLEDGEVSEETLRQVLGEQAREALCDAMAWTEGTFQVERTDELPPEIELALSLELGPCIVEARRRQVRWRQIHDLLPSEDATIEIIDQFAIIDERQDDQRARRAMDDIVDAVGRGATVGEIVLEQYHQRYAVLHRVAQLIERGAARLVDAPRAAGSLERARSAGEIGPAERPGAAAGGKNGAGREAPDRRGETGQVGRDGAPGRLASGSHARQRLPAGQTDAAWAAGAGEMPDDASVADLLAAAESRSRASDPQAALELAGRALARVPDDETARATYQRLERTLFARLCRDLLTSFRVPRLLVDRSELDELDLSEPERYLARRVDGRWDLLSLMRVSPGGEVEALITFKRLADRGILSL